MTNSVKSNDHRSRSQAPSSQTSSRKALLSPVMPLCIAAISGGLIFIFISLFKGRFSESLGFSWESGGIAAASALGIFVFLYAMQIFITHEARSSSGKAVHSEGRPPDRPQDR